VNESAHKEIAVITAPRGYGSCRCHAARRVGWPLLLCDLDAGHLERMAAEFSAGGRLRRFWPGISAALPIRAPDRRPSNKRHRRAHHTAGFLRRWQMRAHPESEFRRDGKTSGCRTSEDGKGGCAVLIASSAAHMVKSTNGPRADRGSRARSSRGIAAVSASS